MNNRAIMHLMIRWARSLWSIMCPGARRVGTPGAAALAILAVSLMWCVAEARADGGSVLGVQQLEGGRLTLLASPVPLSVGPVEFSVLVVDDDGAAAEDVAVLVEVTSQDGSLWDTAIATRGDSQNPLLASAIMELRHAELSIITVRVDSPRLKGALSVTLPVQPSAPLWTQYLPWILLVLPMAFIVGCREIAVARSSRRAGQSGRLPRAPSLVSARP